jgi:hypothetical protein
LRSAVSLFQRSQEYPRERMKICEETILVTQRASIGRCPDIADNPDSLLCDLPNSLLRGLHNLCAMLSPLDVFLAPDSRGLLSVIENCIAGE